MTHVMKNGKGAFTHPTKLVGYAFVKPLPVIQAWDLKKLLAFLSIWAEF